MTEFGLFGFGMGVTFTFLASCYVYTRENFYEAQRFSAEWYTRHRVG